MYQAPRTVLVLAPETDPTADRVASELAGRGIPVTRADTADFPVSLTLKAGFSGDAAGWSGELIGTTAADRAIGVGPGQIQSIYFRHPTQFRLAEGMSGPERIFAYNEARRGFGGVLQALDCRWVNHPVRAAAAEYKPVQLAAAAAAGLRVPDSIITNDPAYARTWASARQRPVIYKPLAGAWHPEDSQIKIVYTNKIDNLDALTGEGIELTAHLFQEWIDKAFEARSIVVGEQVFTVAIRSDSEAGQIDWRADYDSHHYQVIDLPAEIRKSLITLHRRLGLLYGACDLAVTPGGQWVFFEVNPAGQWGWLADACGLPVASALADLLARTR
jgi:ATP-grasp ribosomal peptide maturase